jgi:heptosyltransferase-3
MKILLIQLRRLGDLILTTPAISALREHLPGAQITLAVSADCDSLLPAIHGLQGKFLTKRGLRDLSSWRQIRRTGFDCVVDFTRNDRSAWLTFLSGAPRRIVSERLKIKSKFRARFYNEFVDCAMKQMHTADYCLTL